MPSRGHDRSSRNTCKISEWINKPYPFMSPLTSFLRAMHLCPRVSPAVRLLPGFRSHLLVSSPTSLLSSFYIYSHTISWEIILKSKLNLTIPWGRVCRWHFTTLRRETHLYRRITVAFLVSPHCVFACGTGLSWPPAAEFLTRLLRLGPSQPTVGFTHSLTSHMIVLTHPFFFVWGSYSGKLSLKHRKVRFFW